MEPQQTDILIIGAGLTGFDNRLLVDPRRKRHSYPRKG